MVFAWKLLQNQLSMEIVFNEFRDRFLLFVKSIGNRFSGFLGLENRLKMKGFFVMQADPEKLNWVR